MKTISNRTPSVRRSGPYGRAAWCKLAARLLLIACILTGGSGLAVAADSPSEYRLKAAFLLNFAKFVEWPAGAFPNNRSPMNLCVIGDDPFGSALDQIILGKKIDGRDISALRKRRQEDLRTCQIVFISRSEEKVLPEILNSLKSVIALVVGESPDFAARGGDIQFYMDDNKVRFCVNVDAVQRAHLIVSAKLLALAVIVHDDNHSNGDKT
jgi:hypothetical protein